MNETTPTLPERRLREAPPRKLDLVTQAVLLFGDLVSQTGWGLFALGSIFFWTTSVNSDLVSRFDERNIIWKEHAGVILAADSTGTFQGREPIWRYQHSFAIDGQRYLGDSYSVGKKFDSGQIVFIQYNAADPKQNHIIGLRSQPFSKRVNLLLLLPLLGLPLIFWPIRKNLKIIKLLKKGDFTRGRLVNKNATGRTQKQGITVLPEMQYDFEFEYKGTKYTSSCRTYLTHLVEDEETEAILFYRFRPTFNLVYDAVPNMPKIDAQGKMMALEGWRSWVLFLPTFALAVNLVFYWLG